MSFVPRFIISSKLLRFYGIPALLLAVACAAPAAVPDRIRGTVDARQTRALAGNVNRLAQAQYDKGPVDPAMNLGHIVVLFKPSDAQQGELDRLLADQQNPSSPSFHRWLTPDEFGNRFGLSAGDHSKVVAWLASEGLTVEESGRGRNWIAFGGTAAQVSRTLHTELHRYQVEGEDHFANSSSPVVPAAFGDVVAGFLGLDNFVPRSGAVQVTPDYNSGTNHYLAPEDYSTIYDIAQTGVDGTGVSIAIVGQSAVSLTDIRTFRTRYNLPVNDPKILFYGGTDPGTNGALIEADLDLEWAGAIAPKASLTYVYGTNAFTAIVAAVSLNIAPIISVSYGTCEVNAAMSYYRAIAQQANAQGITILVSSGDSGAAGCDLQGVEPLATRGESVAFPAVLPEVTAVGGTQFAEGSGTYWATANSPNFGSALSYIPETSWNESGTVGLLASGGGASRLYSKPVWQAGPGVPQDNARDVPDMSLSAAGHDAYLVYSSGSLVAVSGTSASAPSMAGIVALLNQYLIKKGVQSQAGLGNINPQLYRLAQTAPTAFHDITTGGNVVACAELSPDCPNGTIGYAAGAGYDMATGLGSLDVNALLTQWNSPAAPVSVAVAASPARPTVNDTMQLTVVVSDPSGAGTPTGTVAFSSNGISLGTATLNAGFAGVFAPLYQLGTGTLTIAAEYSGDATFSTGGATASVRVTAPVGTAAVLVSAPNTVWPSFPDAQGAIWATSLVLREVAGVATNVTGFTIDGVAQSVAQYFPATIVGGGSVTATVNFRGLTAPTVHTFGFSGVDVNGTTWSRSAAVNYYPNPNEENFTLSATPLVIAQNPSADPSCQWAVQLNVDDQGGFQDVISGMYVGGANDGISYASQIVPIFGTTRLDAWNGLQGTVCFSGVTPGGVSNIEVDLASGLIEELTVSFTGPSTSPTKITASPASLAMAANDPGRLAQATLAVGIGDKTKSWTASVFPANRSTSWLSLSQVSGTGPAQITLIANATGYEAGAYRANIVLQSPDAVPQFVNVPVMLVVPGPGTGPALTSIVNPARIPSLLQGDPSVTGSPGALMTIYGTNLASAPATAAGAPLPYSLGGVTATVNGVPAPLLYVSPGQINFQIPYAAGPGPAVVGITNNGQAGGLQFQLATVSPAIVTDSNGNIPGTVVQGETIAIYVNAVGEVSPALKTAYSPSSTTPVTALPKPVAPISVTVGGVPCFVVFNGITPGVVGLAQLNITVPASVPVGNQPVVVTAAGVSSPAGFLTVVAP